MAPGSEYHADTLRALANELLGRRRFERLLAIADVSPLDFASLLRFDREMGGTGMYDMAVHGTKDRYHIADRDVFRPFQYCHMYLSMPQPYVGWVTREVVHMCGLHLEALVDSIAGRRFFTLGRGLNNSTVRQLIEPQTLEKIDRFRKVYNAAKHDLRLPPDASRDGYLADSHLFTVQDAVFAYATCRQLGASLYPHAGLQTPPHVWQGPRLPPTSFSDLET